MFEPSANLPSLFHKVGLFEYGRKEQEAETETCSYPISAIRRYYYYFAIKKRNFVTV